MDGKINFDFKATPPFTEYLVACHALLEARRAPHLERERIIDWNMPFEWRPDKPTQKGILLIHGLLDSPFITRDVGRFFQAQGFLVRSILLPGHGTCPEDLVTVDYHDWIESVEYGVRSLAAEVRSVHLLGISTGATLAIDYSLRHPGAILSLFLLAPAIKIKSKLACISGLPRFIIKFFPRTAWLSILPEGDDVKYRSFPFNAAYQVYRLTKQIKHATLNIPLLMALSDTDETVDALAAQHFFSRQTNVRDRLILLTSTPRTFSDKRIICLNGSAPHIHGISHICMPVDPHNVHYGEQGSYTRQEKLRLQTEELGAISDLKERFTNVHLVRLPFNPCFQAMLEQFSLFMSV